MVYGQVKDIAGNESSCTKYLRIDSEAPSAPTVKNYKANSKYDIIGGTYSSGWYKGYIQVVASGSTDGGGSGFSSYYRRSIGQEENVTNSPGSTRGVSKQGGSVYVYFKACDNAGNCSGETNSGEIKLDRTGPEISLRLIGKSTWSATCTDAYSNINSFKYKEADKDTLTDLKVKQSSLSTDDTKTYTTNSEKNTYFECTDVLDNKTSKAPRTFYCECYASDNKGYLELVWDYSDEEKNCSENKYHTGCSNTTDNLTGKKWW